MRVIATSDVPEDVLRQFRDELRPEFDLDVDGGRVALLSMEPPSWIHFIAQADWWIQGLAAYSALYVAEIVKEAAKDTWKNRTKIVSAAVGVSNKLRRLAEKFINLRNRVSTRTDLIIGLPTPDDHFGAHFELTAADPDTLSLEIALFVHYIPAVLKLIDAEGLNSRKPATGVFLTLLPTCALHVAWFDGESLEKEERVLSLTDEV